MELQTLSAAKSPQQARAGAAVLRRKCACGQHTIGGVDCGACARKEDTLRRRRASDADGARDNADAHESVRRVLDSAGQPLDGATRTFMESRFGQDFSGVRVHTDASAQESARAVNALAYTVGRDVVFGAGQYAPQTEGGRRLIAHELTHTLQQSSASALQRDSLTVAPADDAGEHEAEQVASQIEFATPARRPSVVRPQLQRQPKTKPAKGGASKPPPCPTVGTSESREDLQQAACSPSKVPPKGTPPDCSFTPEQEKMVRASQGEAAERVRRAESVAAKLPDDAAELAKRLFFDEVSAKRVREVLARVRPFLSGDKVQYQGRNCADKECNSSAAVAYVKAAGTLPIFVCPGSFHKPEKLYETVMHEAFHWAGIRAKGEAYCPPDADCNKGCGPSDLADAWMHYVRCISGLSEPHRPRKDFNEKITDSVREVE